MESIQLLSFIDCIHICLPDNLQISLLLNTHALQPPTTLYCLSVLLILFTLNINYTMIEGRLQ